MAIRVELLDICSIDVAAAVQAVTGEVPAIIHKDGAQLATFRFQATPAVQTVLVQYEAGLQIEARRVLTIRSQLFRRLRGGA